MKWMLLGLLMLLASGCAQVPSQVAPWERGALAQREMAITPHSPLKQLRDHVAVSKEAAQGGHQGTGGGCGCN